MERSRQAAGPQGRVSVRLPQGAGWLGGYLIWGAGEFRVGGWSLCWNLPGWVGKRAFLRRGRLLRGSWVPLCTEEQPSDINTHLSIRSHWVNEWWVIS